MRYEAIAKRKPGSELDDYEIRIEGAGKGTGKTATVWGHPGTNAKGIAERIVRALNGSEV